MTDLEIATALSKNNLIDYTVLKRCCGIKNTIQELKDYLNEQKKQYEEAHKKYSNELKLVQNVCTHDIIERLLDLSGNSDNETFCKICGKTL